MKDLRFQLLIEAGPPERGYSLQALSPRGEGRGRFVPPFTAEEMAALDGATERETRHLGVDQEGPQPLDPRAAGERLFAALFQGEILRLYERSLDLLEGDADARLRLEIVLDPREQRLAALQQLPWELLRQPGAPEALALSRRRPVVRYLAVPRPIYAACRPAVLRILAVAADPQPPDLPRLDLEREMRNLRQAVAGARAVNIEIVEPEAPTLAALRRALLDQECHVLHFMGHGGAPDGERDERVLYFATEDGEAEPVRGTDLVDKLSDFSHLRLAVLNACESAAAPDAGTATGAGFDPFAGVATSLVLGGLPAVVAMRLPISDRAAIAFSRAFYERLAAGDRVEAAMAEGRQAVHSVDPAGPEWSVPALFLRTPNGELYPEKDIPPDIAPRPRWPLWLVAAFLVLGLLAGGWFAHRAWQVHQLLSEGVALAEHGQWPEARKIFLKLVKLAPRSAEAHANLAFAEEKVGYLWAAEQHYKQAVRLEPLSPVHLYNLGHFLNGRRRYQDAYKELRNAVRQDPSRVDAHGELASAAMAVGLLDEARDELTTALRLDPKQPVLRRRLGDLELAAGRPAAALAPLNEALRSYPSGDGAQAEPLALLVQAYDRLGDPRAACSEAGEFRHLDPQGMTPWSPRVEEIAARSGCRFPETN